MNIINVDIQRSILLETSIHMSDNFNTGITQIKIVCTPQDDEKLCARFKKYIVHGHISQYIYDDDLKDSNIVELCENSMQEYANLKKRTMVCDMNSGNGSGTGSSSVTSDIFTDTKFKSVMNTDNFHKIFNQVYEKTKTKSMSHPDMKINTSAALKRRRNYIYSLTNVNLGDNDLIKFGNRWILREFDGNEEDTDVGSDNLLYDCSSSKTD